MIGEEAVAKALTRLATRCRERGIAVVYASQGGALDDRMRPLAARLGFRVVDVPRHRAAFLRATSRDPDALRLSPADWHPNVEYHRVLARWLYLDAVRALVAPGAVR
jgi:pyruvate-formate lyase-activating enzyme